MEKEIKLAVLMSTYNGSAYIEKQIESILKQKNIENMDLTIYIRDDGSSDDTIEKIKKIQNENLRKIFLFQEKNIGWANSFYNLLLKVPNEYEYIFFSDQDDIWMLDKISVAVNKMELYEKEPCMYTCSAIMVDNEMNNIGIFKGPKITNFIDSFIKSKYLGCTMALNKKMVLKIKENIREKIVAHDWWCLLSCLINSGKLINDQDAHIFYRQHDTNVLSGSRSIMKRIPKIINNNHKREKLAIDLLGYNIKEPIIIYVSNYRKSLKDKMKLLFGLKIYDGGKKRDILFFKIMILFNAI